MALIIIFLTNKQSSEANLENLLEAKVAQEVQALRDGKAKSICRITSQMIKDGGK